MCLKFETQSDPYREWYVCYLSRPILVDWMSEHLHFIVLYCCTHTDKCPICWVHFWSGRLFKYCCFCRVCLIHEMCACSKFTKSDFFCQSSLISISCAHAPTYNRSFTIASPSPLATITTATATFRLYGNYRIASTDHQQCKLNVVKWNAKQHRLFEKESQFFPTEKNSN